MIEKTIKRLVLKLFPELSARYHLPLFAEVVNVRETPKDGDVCDEFRPYYAVDVQVLDEFGKPDKEWPVLKDVVLSVPVAGHEMGQFAFPENGCWVEIAFAYGSPNRPFIRSVLPHGLTLPQIERGEQRWQHNSASFQQADKDGNWQRKTNGNIHDESLNRLIDALDLVENFHQSTKNTETNDTEIIGAIKRIEAFGAVVVQAGGVLDLSALDSIRLTTKVDAIIRVLGNMLSTVDGDITETAGGNISQTATLNIEQNAVNIIQTAIANIQLNAVSIQTAASASQSYIAPSTYIGTAAENAIALMADTAQLVVDLADIIATHTHPNVGAMSQGGAVATVSTQVSAIKTRINSIL